MSMVRPGGRIYAQRDATVKALDKIDSLTFVKNKAAFYLFPKIDVKRHNITDDKKFARDLLMATKILIVPGSGFEWQNPDHFRIVMLPEAEILSEAVNKIGKFCGAGSLVPITGFANSVVSPAMEYKSEGYIMGVGGKMFTVAGPVLVFGISSGIIVGLLYLIFNTQAVTLV